MHVDTALIAPVLDSNQGDGAKLSAQPTGVEETVLSHVGHVMSTHPGGGFTVHGGDYCVWHVDM